MASFGEGFSSGLRSGAAVAHQGIQNYKARQEEEATNQLFGAALGLQQKGQEIEGEEQERANVMGMFDKASVGDITQAIVDNFAANGGKVNDQTYKLATGVASTLFGIKQKEQEFQQKKTLFGLDVQKTQADIANVYDTMNKRVRGDHRSYKPSSYESEYNHILATRGKDAAEAWQDKRIHGKDSPAVKDPTVKQIDDGMLILSRQIKGFDELDPREQWKASQEFAKTGNLPEVETYEEKGRLFGTNTKYRLKVKAAADPKKPAADGKKIGSAKYHRQ